MIWARDFLLQIQRCDRMVNNKLAEAAQWKALALNTVSAPPPDTGVRVQSSSNQQKMSAAIDRYVDIEKEIDAYIDRLDVARREVIEIIEKLDTVQYDVLHKMYVGVVDKNDSAMRTKYYTLNEIAESYDRSYSWAKGKRGQALKNVQRLLDARANETK